MTLLQFNLIHLCENTDSIFDEVSSGPAKVSICRPGPKFPALAPFLPWTVARHLVIQTQFGSPAPVSLRPHLRFLASRFVRSVVPGWGPSLRFPGASGRLHPLLAHRGRTDSAAAFADASTLRWLRCARARCKTVSLPGNFAGGYRI